MIELNNQYLEIVEKFCYLGNTIEAKWGAINSTMTVVRSGWSRFRDLRA